jgi:predicted secreted hydrolase
MRITGTLARDGTTGSITGTSNFLHGWGFLPLLDAVTYNTFSFSLPDGRDIWLLYFHVGGVGSLRVGSISDPEGHITVLHPSDWRAVPTGTWQRDSTCTYPVDWNVTVKGMHFQARPSLLNPELRATRSPQIYALWPEWPNYWSGETVFTGDAAGRGWLEDGGYCRT